MNYEIYKNSRDAAWQFLIKHNVRSLPVDLKSITAEMGIIVRRDVLGILKSGERGKTADANGQPLIICKKQISYFSAWTTSIWAVFWLY